MVRSEGGAAARLAVVATIVGALAFGGYLGYLAWSNNSFPAEERPFDDYAQFVSGEFNGTEYSVRLAWLDAGYLPLYAQLRSDATEAANTPVCDLRLDSVAAGQPIDLPFKVAKPTAALSGVDLSIAVKALGTGAEFTITHHVDQVEAQEGNVPPIDIACGQGGTRT